MRCTGLASLGTTVVLALMFLGASPGCTTVESVKPIYKPKDILHDDSLLGTWSTPEQWWILSRYPKHSYLLTMIEATPERDEENSVSAFPIDMVKIGGSRYWFATIPQGPNLLSPGVRIQTEGDDLLIEWISAEGLAASLKRDSRAPSHVTEGSGPMIAIRPMNEPPDRAPTTATSRPLLVRVIMTGSPREIREFLIRHENDPALFTEPRRMKRAAPG